MKRQKLMWGLAAMTLATGCTQDLGDSLTTAGAAQETGDEAGGGAGDGDDIKLDIGPGGGEGVDPDPGWEGCEKVDFLFVIDNSGSMDDEQSNLIVSFYGFIDKIREDVHAEDYNIMVVDTDDNPLFSCEPELNQDDPICDLWCGSTCPSTNNCQGYACGDMDLLDEADTTMGCGVRRPYGGEASNKDCGIVGDRRYMKHDQPDLEDTFACAARVGISGYWKEQPLTAMLRALSPELNETGACNDGFLREDALLVVTFISDDVKANSLNGPDDVWPDHGPTPEQWHQQILDLKGGNPENVVMLGIVATDNPPAGCNHAEGQSADKFMQFINLFGERGAMEDVCANDYSEFFDASVEGIAEACTDFTYVP